MSDVHGEYEKFNKMLELIRFDDKDKLYILGDVIDRGPQPLAILQKIAVMKNVIFIIGNHEHMMYKSIKDGSEFYNWFNNGGEKTYNEFCSLGHVEQTFLMNYIKQSYAIVPQLICHNNAYYLVHAAPLERFVNKPVKYKQLSDYEKYHVLWERKYTSRTKQLITKEEHDLFRQYKNTYLICGHTRTRNCYFGMTDINGESCISIDTKRKIIDVDCGCSYHERLGCLCIDNLKEYYV